MFSCSLDLLLDPGIISVSGSSRVDVVDWNHCLLSRMPSSISTIPSSSSMGVGIGDSISYSEFLSSPSSMSSNGREMSTNPIFFLELHQVLSHPSDVDMLDLLLRSLV